MPGLAALPRRAVGLQLARGAVRDIDVEAGYHFINTILSTNWIQT